MKFSLLLLFAVCCTFARAASVADGSALSTSSKGTVELAASQPVVIPHSSEMPLTGSADLPNSNPSVLANAKGTSVPESVSVVALVVFGYVLMLRRRSI